MSESKFDKIWQQIAPIRPELDAIMEMHGNTRLVDYVRGIWSYRPDSVYKGRLPEIAGVLGRQVRRLWGDETAARIEQRFPEAPVVSTGDHHGILSFPLFVHSNLMFCLDSLISETPDSRVLLATGNIPLMNFTFPRGITLTEPNAKGRPTTIPMFPYKMERTWVYGAPAYGEDAVEKAADRTQKLARDGMITEQKESVVQDTLQNVIGGDDILNQPDYAAQSSVVNTRLWQKFFSERPPAELLPLQLEEIVSQWLVKALEEDQDLPVIRMLLDSRWREQATGLFNGVPGCWDTERKTGSFLFWGAGTRGQPISLWEDEPGRLIGIDPSTKEPVNFELNSRTLADMLSRKLLIPNLLVTFTTLSFYFGIRCYGGFMQTDYLVGMKQGWLSLLRNFGFDDEAELVSEVPTANYLTGPSTSFVRHGETLTGSGTFDLIERGGLRPHELNAAAGHTVWQLNTPSLPVIYRIIMGSQADPDLADVDIYEAVEHGKLQDLILR